MRKQSTRLALKREAQDAQLLKQSKPEPEPSKGKRTACDKLSDFLPDVKVPRTKMLPVHKRSHPSYYQACSLIRFTEIFTSTPILR